MRVNWSVLPTVLDAVVLGTGLMGGFQKLLEPLIARGARVLLGPCLRGLCITGGFWEGLGAKRLPPFPPLMPTFSCYYFMDVNPDAFGAEAYK
jgi:hypothetical protein